MKVTNRQTRGDALLDMLLTNNKVVQDVKIMGSFGSSDHETMNFKIVREFNKTDLQLWISELLILAFWGLLRSLLELVAGQQYPQEGVFLQMHADRSNR